MVRISPTITYLILMSFEDIVSEMIWVQVHLSSSILCSSVPIYIGVKNMCCIGRSNHMTPIEAWLLDINSTPEPSTIARASKETSCFSNATTASIPCGATTPTTRRISFTSTQRFISRRPSESAIRHGDTREILIRPYQQHSQHDISNLVFSRPPSTLENATKRLIYEAWIPT